MLSHLLLDLHPALLLLLLLDFQLLILLLTLFDGSRRGRSRRPLLRSSRRSDPAAAMRGLLYGVAGPHPPASCFTQEQAVGPCGLTDSSRVTPVTVRSSSPPPLDALLH